MKKKMITIVTALLLIVSTSLTSAAHYIVGNVEDALDGELANGKIVTLWNPSNSILDNLTDIVGPSGNSGANNIYFMDCELLQTPCQIGDNLTLKIFNSGDNYISNSVNVTVEDLGFDLAGNLTLNSPLIISSIEVEDDLTNPINEIDLLPATTKTVSCIGIIQDLDNETEIKNASAIFFNTETSSYSNPDDNNDHYTNSSCNIDLSYSDEYTAQAICTFEIEYYANPNNWNCTIEAFDIHDLSDTETDGTTINTLLALEVNSLIDFGTISTNQVSEEIEINITNFGNVQINLSLSGYGESIGDNNAMKCSINGTIPIQYEKFNLTTSNPGFLTLSEFEEKYMNLTSDPKIRQFNLNHRQDDIQNNASNKTYWRIYLPESTVGNCTGNLVIGAVQGGED